MAGGSADAGTGPGAGAPRAADRLLAGAGAGGGADSHRCRGQPVSDGRDRAGDVCQLSGGGLDDDDGARVTGCDAGEAVLAGGGVPGGGSEKPGASATPVTIRFNNGVGDPTTDAFNDAFKKRMDQKYNGKINVQVEPFPDPDWAVRFQKFTAMSLA